MPLVVPSLDDRTYADLVQEGIALIPRHAPRWTNHNVSDPGITLVELFAYLTEILLYRLDRLSDASKAKFLKLLTGEVPSFQNPQELEAKIRKSVLELRTPFRAVSCEDFERLAYEATEKDLDGQSVGRAQCFPRRNLEAATEDDRRRDRPGHISVILVPQDLWAADETVQVIKEKVKQYLEPRRLLTSRLHVVGPSYLDLGLQIGVALLPGLEQHAVRGSIRKELERYFHPLHGGPKSDGWPFGRSVYVSDVYRLVEAVDGVDHVTAVELDVPDSTRLRPNELGKIVEAQLRAAELVRFRVADTTFVFPADRP